MLGIRTDMKIAEHSREYGNVSKVLKGVIMILIKVSEAAFERYKEDILEMIRRSSRYSSISAIARNGLTSCGELGQRAKICENCSVIP